eukprot:Amastigsp_a842004_297.p5 type:complete len:136 gc:universal Amastigsp_a842004_297:409-2(-)
MSIWERGNSCISMTDSNVAWMSSESSLERRSPFVPRFRSPVANVAMENSALRIAESSRARAWKTTSRGPYTAATTFVLPCSRYAEPSACERMSIFARSLRSSSGRRPSRRRPSADTNSRRAMREGPETKRSPHVL